MAYLFFEILGSLVLVAVISFTLGWLVRGFRETRNRGSRVREALSDDELDLR